MGQDAKTGERVDTFRVGVVKSARRDNRKASVSFFLDRIPMMDLSESKDGVLLEYLLRTLPRNTEFGNETDNLLLGYRYYPKRVQIPRLDADPAVVRIVYQSAFLRLDYKAACL